MASPAKRRKKNDLNSSPRAGRNLDFFFGKKSQEQNNPSSPLEPPANDKATAAEAHLSDEELARKLQEEWNNENASLNAISDDNRDPTAGLPGQQLKKQPEQKPIRPPTKTLSLQSAAHEEDALASSIPFDEDVLKFNPLDYTDQLKAQWEGQGGHATYALLTRCFVLVNSTRSRIKIVDTLVNFLRTVILTDPKSLISAVWLTTNAISPPYISLELGIGGSILSKALINVCGLNNSSLRTLYAKHGDPGDVAFEAKVRQSFTLRKPNPLTMNGVYQSLVKIARSQGKGSQETKQRIVERLIQDARGGEESRYIVRTLVQHLRIGAVKTTMLIALARAFLLTRPVGAEFETRSVDELGTLNKEARTEIYLRAEEIVKACFARRPNYNDLVAALLEVGVSDELLLRCEIALHVPLKPMLGSITRDLSDMLTKVQGRDFSCEFKYDGQRAQIHCDEDGKVTIFSRHLEVMTDKYPDLVELIPKIRGEGVGSFIMEGEVVAIDRASGNLKTFQTLAGRARKDVIITSVKVDVCLFAFDLMYLNGEPLLERSFRERRDLLRSLFTEVPGQFTWVKSLDFSGQDSEQVLEFFKGATELKCEGIMVKLLDNTEAVVPPPTSDTPVETKTRRKPLLSTYTPDKRLLSWLKVKKDYDTVTSETLDLIPVAAWHGNGRKAAWWSPILLAVRNEETGSLEAVAKCMSGFTDAFYKTNRAKYDPVENPENCLGEKPAWLEYTAGHPSVWFNPNEVWEVAFADLTRSPVYTAAIDLVGGERGISLRFPRFLKVRDDKSIDEASTTEFLANLFFKQEQQAAENPPVEEVDEDDEV